MKKISIITGVYNEEVNVKDVYEVIKDVFQKLKKYHYEHIFMDNCSTDDTLKILKKIAAKDKNVKILSYSKNFGPINSGFTGLLNTTGDAVIPYEGNMKDPPELIATFIRFWEQGYQLVYGVRKKTADNFFMSFLRRSFYRMMNVLSSGNLPLYFGGFCLLDRQIVNEIKKIDDYKPYLRGLISSAGFKQKSINYARGPRPKGKGESKSDFAYLMDFTFNAIISYSIVPIRLCTFLGLSLSVLSIVAATTYYVIKLYFGKIQIPDISSLVFLIIFSTGIQLFFIGVIGEYIGAIHSQVRKKPFVIIKEKINFDD